MAHPPIRLVSLEPEKPSTTIQFCQHLPFAKANGEYTHHGKCCLLVKQSMNSFLTLHLYHWYLPQCPKHLCAFHHGSDDWSHVFFDHSWMEEDGSGWEWMFEKRGEGKEGRRAGFIYMGYRQLTRQIRPVSGTYVRRYFMVVMGLEGGESGSDVVHTIRDAECGIGMPSQYSEQPGNCI